MTDVIWVILCAVRRGAYIGGAGRPPHPRHLPRCPSRAGDAWRRHYLAVSAQAATWAEERDLLRHGVEDALDLARCLQQQLDCGGDDGCGCTACDLVADLNRLAEVPTS